MKKICKVTPFQIRVWREMMKIPKGRTVTYKDIAEAAGSKRAYRAVGRACRDNPFPFIIPCHRVVGVGGRLGGYNRGVRMKKALLSLERDGL